MNNSTVNNLVKENYKILEKIYEYNNLIKNMKKQIK